MIMKLICWQLKTRIIAVYQNEVLLWICYSLIFRKIYPMIQCIFIFEGIAKYHIIDILQVIIDGPEKRATLNDINTNIKYFNFGANKSKNRPSPIKPSILEDNPSLSMTASQTWSFVMLFPFIMDDIVDITHRDYDFFNLLRLIILITFSSKIKSSHLSVLENTIEEYYNYYIKHPTLSNVPKLHYLGHLIDSIKR